MKNAVVGTMLVQGGSLQFTIEARQLTNEWTRRGRADVASRRTTVEASGPGEALTQFVRENHWQLVSFVRPAEGRESIATVRKNDSVFLVRVYAE